MSVNCCAAYPCHQATSSLLENQSHHQLYNSTPILPTEHTSTKNYHQIDTPKRNHRQDKPAKSTTRPNSMQKNHHTRRHQDIHLQPTNKKQRKYPPEPPLHEGEHHTRNHRAKTPSSHRYCQSSKHQRYLLPRCQSDYRINVPPQHEQHRAAQSLRPANAPPRPLLACPACGCAARNSQLLCTTDYLARPFFLCTAVNEPVVHTCFWMGCYCLAYVPCLVIDCACRVIARPP